MSYRCFISFKKMQAEEIIPFLKSFKQEAINRLEQIAEKNCAYCPYIDKSEDTVFNNTIINEQKLWVRHVLSFRFFYDKEFKLLGVLGVCSPLEDMFDKTVYFQNSCDQDYPKEEYEGIEKFEEIYDKWMNKSSEEINKLYKEEYDEDLTNDSVDENYYRRTWAYDEIWSRYENELYEDEKAVYFSLFESIYEVDKVYKFLRLCFRAYNDWNKKWEKEHEKENKNGN